MSVATTTIVLPTPSTSDIELESPRQEVADPTLDTRFASNDNIVAQSQLADSSVPEGGYGWVILGACFVLTWWAVGINYCWGVMQAVLVERHLSNLSTLSFVGSLSAAIISVLAIANARVLRRIGARSMAMLGITVLGLGQILSGFTVDNVSGLFVTAGAIQGVGISLCFIVISVLPAQYFSRKRGLANGLVFAGGGLGGAVMSFVMNALLHKWGPAWTFRAIGIMELLTGLPAAWLIQERTSIRRSTFIDWSLFKDFSFVVLFIAGGIATFPLFVPPYFVPLYSTSIGLSSSTGAGLVAAFNFSSALGRIGFGVVADRIGPVNSLLICLTLGGLSVLAIWPISDTLGPLLVFVIVNGVSNGGFFSLMPTVVGSLFGSVRVAVAMGMIVTAWGGGYLMGSPIAGYLLQAFGGTGAGLSAYRPAMYYAGSLSLLAAALVAVIRVRKAPKLLKKL